MGVLNPLPRTPAIYEQQTKWSLEDDPLVVASLEAANYASVSEHEQFVYEHFDEEVKEGLMREMSEKDLREEFGEHVAIAALAVLVDEVTGKKRIIHDASNKVRVNHKIKCQDKQRMPGAKEKFTLLRYYKDRREVLFSILGDVSKAHRRFKHCKEEHGYLACKVKETDSDVYVNKVGTFGVGSASYWWGRLFGAVVRATYAILGSKSPVELLTYADDLEAIGPGKAGRRAVVQAFFIMCIFGVPFKFSKQRGGMQVDWIGLHSDYTTYQLGLSVGRAAWLSDWCSKLSKQLRVGAREVTSGLGRLCFAANALYWERPFLGPIYAWAASVRNLGHVVTLPWAIAFILAWLAKKLGEGGRLQSPPSMLQETGELFRTDAKAEDGRAWIGGWETLHSMDTRKARWFALEVEETWCPWIFCKKKDPNRVIAALELLGTLVAVMLFGDDWPKHLKANCLVGSARTDNQGNSFAVAKLMSTRFPLTLVIMELSEQLKVRNLELHLGWIQRDSNQPADDLTNDKFGGFSDELRIQKKGEDLDWLVMGELLASSQLLYDEIAGRKQERRVTFQEPAVEHRPKAKRKRAVLGPW